VESENDIPENVKNDEEIMKILRDSLKMKLQNDKKIPTKIQLNKALISTLSEFLACYKIIGYDLDGNPIRLNITNNKLEDAALTHLFVQEMGRYVHGA
jgi:hypothetical protein